MLDVMKRLAELDAANPNMNEGAKPDFTDVDDDGNEKESWKKAEKDAEEKTDESMDDDKCEKCHPEPCSCDEKTDESVEDFSIESLRYLSGLKSKLAESGISMLNPTPVPEHKQPATFSINASAETGDEVASMLTQIMNLAGVSKVGNTDMPHGDMPGATLTAEPLSKIAAHGGHDGGADLMRATLDKMNDQPEDEDLNVGGIMGNSGGGAMPGAGAALGGTMPGVEMEDEGEEVSAGGNDSMQSMADEIRGMAAKLKDIEDKDELNLETYDNTPASATDIPKFDGNGLAYNPNAGGVNKGLTNAPSAMAEDLEAKLFADYQAFVTEGEKTMSKAAKGYEKYGKKGMQALADAGKKGKSLEPVKAKYNKYD